MAERLWGFKSPPEHQFMKLLVATRNAHKLQEIRAVFNLPGIDLVGTDQVPGLPEVEDGRTFEENAVKKASTLARLAGMWALADDSGLEVEALGGDPGVYSARYAGEPVSYPANNAKLLAALGAAENRRARFCCVIALSAPDGATRNVTGHCHGVITHAPRGSNGFGYDPVFVPDGHALTFAEMDGALKNRLSHRGAALQRARDEWRHLLAALAAGSTR
jgi:non-canonical purine NTP pyrophosphatase (RdgB/HAM1 family)